MIKNRKHKIYIILVIVSVVIAAFWIWLTPWVWYDSNPKPLGDKVEFIEKRNYGCLVGFCDSKPGASYYYVTSLSIDNLSQYFKKASPHRQPKQEGNFTSIWLGNSDTKESFFIYYNNQSLSDMELNALNIERTDKSIIKIDATDYLAAKDSL